MSSDTQSHFAVHASQGRDALNFSTSDCADRLAIPARRAVESIAEPQASPPSTLHFKNYLLENVYLRTTEPQRSEVIALWQNEEAITDLSEAQRRSHEAVLLIRNPTGELAGLSTVGFVRAPDGRVFYAYRMFLRRQHRVSFLMVAVILATRDFLQTFQHPSVQAAGMLHINENPKLMRPGIHRLFEKHDYRYWGTTPQAEDVWVFEFDEPPQTRSTTATLGKTLKRFIPFWSSRSPTNLTFTPISEVA